MRLKKKYSLQEISKSYKSVIKGDPSVEFDSVCSLTNSQKKSISYISDSRFLSLINYSNLECLITNEEISNLINNEKISLLINDNPQLIFSKLINDSINLSSSSLFSPNPKKDLIPDSTLLGAHVSIGSNVTIGENCIIYPNSTLCDGTVIGNNVVIHPGAVIGSDGFGLVQDEGKWIKVPHIGNVIIKNDVEIGAGTTIDRGTLDSTVISKNVKIDNLVHIAHNVFIDENTAIAACVGIAGSTSIGKNCTIGGGSGINGHITIVDNVHIHGMTMVTKSINKEGMYASGTTVEPVASWRKNQARFKELDLLAKAIKKIT
ncbi:MAG: UDP-3-O-(3-hydroxymyristoyl)glucosamine N-acyltransferase [Gammaproteobacteria bacterium]